jgi:hypothetical protein
MFGFMFAAASLMVLLGIYSLVFRQEVIRAFPKPIRYIFWGYFIISIIIVIWAAAQLIMGGV